LRHREPRELTTQAAKGISPNDEVGEHLQPAAHVTEAITAAKTLETLDVEREPRRDERG